MTTRDDVARWRALADAEELPDGPWRGCGAHDGKCPCGLVWSTTDDVCVATAGAGGDPLGAESTLAVRDFIAASREAVPAMADALVELMALVEWCANEPGAFGLQTAAATLVAKWRGDAPGGEA